MVSHPPVWRLKIQLLGITPTVWRRLDTYADVELSQLHYFIQGAMGWELMHLFSFGHGNGSEIPSKRRLCDVSGIGETLIYTYDFGDDWQHRVTVEKMMEKPTESYPHLITGKNACPPEDCGGPWGYAEMLRVLAGRSSTRRRELTEWLGGPFDPSAFDISEARERLAEYAKLSMPKAHR
ncbi:MULTISPECIES: plasmid pRiA4b ORF-3 family protein [Xanthomonas]|uniref:Plasmid pRiA4b Orf3-like domain-containing protein n=1 Tax=Xanthomonas phaseoli pv. syngonii LMG 9055 TaxID=1437878 RepID=A0A1V9GJM1_9XANT|nr:plasmid pRiA4b ORF-3 family protein [Xanthomonas phaseoli]OQP70843.1 hypothetical protein IA54_015740 [Xanthomonas phaseoli pv. syngonii LMG 9055]MBO9768260.1 plasmid pRiA4b ORF-3 family protein [Xanthomonas phaseoli pv. dieffenbachiae]MBO9774391.1 plasmid pRiA4b ORF-3 family protein [Xanthomonas phaseoli pv. dieffenbachiae]MBO9782144.1 plasmid pRiA4b ORF-3 family protein [Xanthomonas phaseoli pv. dieffenbachiae]MBO9798013.1 plasmid pRiA4b ORF-3 family protein [Xanthomonas phaseoli pv. dief